MPDPSRRIYWDSCVFLSYVNAVADRMSAIETLLEEAEKGAAQILTSTVTIVEVAFAASERLAGSLDLEVDRKIGALWVPPSPVRVVELHIGIAEEARRLVRMARERGWSLRPMDAIHLSTARQLGVGEFHTYDERLHRYTGDLGFPISVPVVTQQRLGL